MCGICGFTGQRDPSLIRKMTAIMKHRGPDADGFFESNECSLGHVRLSIIDLSTSANQPMTDPEETLIVSFNGEIYNYQDLQAELTSKGHAFRTTSDTEVILAAYKEFGERFVERLDGMFAIALYDAIRKVLYLYRDRFGKKPLFYYASGSKLFFASELKALLASEECPSSISEDAFFTYLGLQYCFTHQCILEGVKKLPPASYLKAGIGNDAQIINYWNLYDHPLADGELKTDEEMIEELFFRAVKKRLIADVPVGVLLSGGVDSSAVTVVMSRLTETPIRTFTAGFDAPDDEFPFAREIVRQEKTEHRELSISLSGIIEELPKIVWYMDEPLADGGGIATYFVARELKNYVKVVLVGEGGDELFGGYSWHKMGVGIMRMVPEAIKKRIYLYLNSFAHSSIRTRFAHDAFALFKREPHKAYHKDFLFKMTNFERMALLPNSLLMKVDRMTMAFGVEARVPFLDEDLLRYVMMLSPDKRLGKKVFKNAMQRFLPPSILARRKQGFRAPFNEWFDSGLHEHCQEIILDRQSFSVQVLGKRTVEDFFKPAWNRLGQIQNEAMVWRLLIFELWKKQVLDTCRY